MASYSLTTIKGFAEFLSWQYNMVDPILIITMLINETTTIMIAKRS